MRSIFQTILVSLVLITLLACGKAPNLAQSEGRADRSIRHGDRIASNVMPAVGLIKMLNKNLTAMGFCSGSLIDNDLILTAAHCVTDESNGGILSPNRLLFSLNEKPSFTSNATYLPVALVRRHPDYKPLTSSGPYGFNVGGNDVAIIRLKNPVSGRAPFGMAMLSDSFFLPSPTRSAAVFTVVGYGDIDWETTARKARGTSVFVDFTDGQNRLGRPVPRGLFVVKANARGQIAAPGDSGGPALINEGGNLVIAGVVSVGTYQNVYYTNLSIGRAARTWLNTFLPRGRQH